MDRQTHVPTFTCGMQAVPGPSVLSFQPTTRVTRSFAPCLANGNARTQRNVGPVMADGARPTATTRRARLNTNAPGDVYVNAACIDCDTCRWLAPETFGHADGLSYVRSQPETREYRLRALAAAVACPTGAILTEKPADEAREARSLFPLAVNEDKSVYYLGYASEASYGASSWLVLTPSACIMVDVPRYNSGLAANIERLIASKARPEGIDYIVLSHQDDVASHDAWANRFPSAKRVIHRSECNGWQKTDACEIKLDLGEAGSSDRMELADGVFVIHVPGHTKGSIALLDTASRSLFTGDHLFYSTRVDALFGSTTYIRHSWRVQQESVAKLADEPFLSIYPGHGRMYTFASAEDRRKGIAATVDLMAKTRCHVP
jgi:glyoxylase-like metal-dependent hydrolase (beta-lactamase superfamily II)/ferredoxin